MTKEQLNEHEINKLRDKIMNEVLFVASQVYRNDIQHICCALHSALENAEKWQQIDYEIITEDE